MRRRDVLAVIAALGAGAASPGGLQAFVWRKRVVLVFGPHVDDPRVQRQRRALHALTRRNDDRDLQLVTVLGEAVAPPVASADALRREFKVEPGVFTALLLGKDGGVKLRSRDAISADRLVSTIDAMPMRRDEMARRPG
jgi:hypothetical protein